MAGAGEERAGRLLDAGAGRVEQPDERHPLGERHLPQAGDLELAGHPHRAGHHGEVVGGDAAGPAVDVAPAGDHTVGGSLDAVHRPLGEVRAAVDPHLDEGALVDEQVEPLARGQLAALVLFGDLLLAAAKLRLLAALVQLLGEVVQRRRSRQEVLRFLLGAPHPYLPFHCGSRFSKNAVTPSTMSSVEKVSESCERR